MEQEDLWNKLKMYSKTQAYPFHMPGHKRNFGEIINPYEMDITEIYGFDDLHHPEGILEQIQKRAARIYGAEESFLLINGSTVGILSAIAATCRKNGKIVMARNSHKSAYHAVYLNELQVEYLYPEYISEYEMNGGIVPEHLRALLEEDSNHEIQAVYITSPTYEGILSDIGRIADIAHAYGLPLIVDEAHGAHLYFSELFPTGALAFGADIVIQSVHKTLPSFTQTALLHINHSEFVNVEKVKQYLRMYQSSSPSYLLMAGIDRCLRYVEEQGREKLQKLSTNLQSIYGLKDELKKLRIMGNEVKNYASVYDFDVSKIVVSTKGTRVSGDTLKSKLREEYLLELEMAAPSYALAMTTLCDTEEGIQRLRSALLQIEQDLPEEEVDKKTNGADRIKRIEKIEKNHNSGSAMGKGRPQAKMTIAQGMNSHHKRILIRESENHISGEFLYVYPPGIPILAPGELITREIIWYILELKETELSLQGVEDEQVEFIKVVIR